jgi:hypothetical protein
MKHYDFIDDYYNGVARVKLNNKYGIINENGNEICEIKYDYCYNFNFDHNFAKVKLNNKYGYIDINGNEICEIKYDSIGVFIDGFAIVEINKKLGVINISGEEIFETKYNYDEIFNILDLYVINHERNLKLNQIL